LQFKEFYTKIGKVFVDAAHRHGFGQESSAVICVVQKMKEFYDI